MEELQYGTRKISYSLERKERKTLAIEVHPDTTVAVIAPLGSSNAEIEEKLLKRARWVIKQQQFFEQFLPSTPPREYVPGETHFYLGRKYLLKVQEGEENTVKLKGGELVVVTKNKSPENVKRLLMDWYYSHADRKFDEIYTEALQMFHRYRLKRQPLYLRKMRSRWGSCTAKGKVILNPEIIKAPSKCILYVIVHELCHQIQYNHSKKFYDIQSEIMPDWERWKNRLERILV